jgi:hypothetical protein
MAYSPADNSVYLAHGASGSGNHPHDFWRYDLDSSKWESLGAAPDQTANWDCACEVNLIYAEGELWYFKNCRDVFVFNVQTKSWRTLRIGEDRYAVTPLGAKGIFDPVRKNFVFYGGMYPGPSNLMATLNKTSLTWSTSNGPRALKYAAMAYSEKNDLYFVGAAGQDTVFIYDPKTSAWKAPVAGGVTGPGDRYVEFAYSDSLNLLVTLKGLDLYTMQYQDSTTLPPTSPPDSCNSDTVFIRDTITVLDTIRFTDTVTISPPTKKGVFKVGLDTLLILDVLN